MGVRAQLGGDGARSAEGVPPLEVHQKLWKPVKETRRSLSISFQAGEREGNRRSPHRFFLSFLHPPRSPSRLEVFSPFSFSPAQLVERAPPTARCLPTAQRSFALSFARSPILRRLLPASLALAPTPLRTPSNSTSYSYSNTPRTDPSTSLHLSPSDPPPHHSRPLAHHSTCPQRRLDLSLRASHHWWCFCSSSSLCSATSRSSSLLVRCLSSGQALELGGLFLLAVTFQRPRKLTPPLSIHRLQLEI